MKSATRLALDLIRQGTDPGAITVRLALRKHCWVARAYWMWGAELPRYAHHRGSAHCGIDGYEPSVAEAKRLNTHDEIIHGDVRDLADISTPNNLTPVLALTSSNTLSSRRA